MIDIDQSVIMGEPIEVGAASAFGITARGGNRLFFTRLCVPRTGWYVVYTCDPSVEGCSGNVE